MIKQTENGVLIEVRIKPNSKRFALSEKNGQPILEVTSPPREGKANLEIVKGLKRLFGKDVEIVKGSKSREKLILVKNADKEEIEVYFGQKSF
jgi:uncharacterized protein (TIGR00251 family)